MSKLPFNNTFDKLSFFVESGKSPEEIYGFYNKWAEEGSYDDDMATANSRGPMLLADAFASVFPVGERDISVIDIAAGTGRGGAELFKRGFTNLDAVDPSLEMLKIAELKRIYKKLFCAPVGYEPLNIPEGTYDAVSCVGGLAEGHLPASAVEEFIRLVKPGGMVIMVSNGNTWKKLPEYHEKMATMMDDLASKGKIGILRKEFLDGYRLSSEEECAKAMVIVLKRHF